MYFKVSWDEDFATLMMYLWGKYGRHVFTLNGIGDQLDLHKFSKEFFNSDTTTADISVDANANVTSKSVIEYSFEFPKPLQRYNSHYLLWKALKDVHGVLEANQLIEKQISGEIYINDFSDVSKPYCFNFSTYDIALSGLTMSSRMKINPPKSLDSFIRQIEQFTVYAANSTLGATGLADFLIVASLYVQKILDTGYDHKIRVDDVETYVSEKLRSFIFTVNWEFRGNQSPFSNVSVYDEYFLNDLVPDYVFDGECAKVGTVSKVQEIFLDAMNSELERSPLTFPVTTACFMVKGGLIQDERFLNLICSKNMKFGFINIYYGDSSTLSSCCRLRSSTDNEYFNSFGSGSTKIGSLGVVTVNFPRIAELALENSNTDPKDVFVESVLKSVREVAIINNAKRNIISSKISKGAMPLYTLGHMDLSKQYSTFGVTGLNEALEILSLSVFEQEGQEFVVSLLEKINKANKDMSDKYKAPHNCEQVPAESSSVKLAQIDSALGYNKNKYKLYSNQFIPLTAGADMLDRVDIQGRFDQHFSGGAICHINFDHELKDKGKLVDLMKYAAAKGVVYWAVNYALKRCVEGHVWVDGDVCPYCGNAVDHVDTRVVGFFTNVKNWNKARRDHDWKNRKFYSGV